ncbi:hypothetical protein FS837_001860 [Tulasnella sp. UAMH 9824]|nr:hypothetical protein FS837_001860 [Tulasnella sp. UAMH 9824]
MCGQKAIGLVLAVVSILGGVIASQTIVVEAQDERIRYDSIAITGPAWELVPPSNDGCDTPQMLTKQEGDYMSFTFTGTGISVVGAASVGQSVIDFYVDGILNKTVDQGRPELRCGDVLFELSDLPEYEHTIVGMLWVADITDDTGEGESGFSLQRLE